MGASLLYGARILGPCSPTGSQAPLLLLSPSGSCPERRLWPENCCYSGLLPLRVALPSVVCCTCLEVSHPYGPASLAGPPTHQKPYDNQLKANALLEASFSR